MKLLFLAGNWVENIRESGYMKKLYSDITLPLDDLGIAYCFQNGGTEEELQNYLKRIPEFDVVLWFVNVPNEYPKMLELVKVQNKKCLLVMSKSNIFGKYDNMELVARMLKVKANLMLEFGKTKEELISTSILDPLNNCYLWKELNIKEVGRVLVKRINQLLSFKRIGSERVEGMVVIPPDEMEFFAVGRTLANTFHDLIHPAATERFLGNMSFRCENGFPSFRGEHFLYVSRRNIDKRMIDKDGFVPVVSDSFDKVKYYGDFLPSVDAPIQIRLFDYYKAVNYMIHSHVYVESAPYTDFPIPCGAIDEVDVIKELWSDKWAYFAVNLRGHGSIVAANSPEYFSTVKYVSRPSPEIIQDF